MPSLIRLQPSELYNAILSDRQVSRGCFSYARVDIKRPELSETPADEFLLLDLRQPEQ